MKLLLTEKEWQFLVALVRRPGPDGKRRTGGTGKVRRTAAALRALEADRWDARAADVDEAAASVALERAEKAGIANAQQLALAEGQAAVLRMLNRLSRTAPAKLDAEGRPQPLVLSSDTLDYLQEQIDEESKGDRLDLADAMLVQEIVRKVGDAQRAAEAKTGSGAEDGANGTKAAETTAG